jgi:uncharacterized protein YeaO (DUF488 family)
MKTVAYGDDTGARRYVRTGKFVRVFKGCHLAITIVRLGSPRGAKEGLRIGTVRRPPRGVPKAEFARRDYYDVWLPNLSPSQGLVKQALAAQAAKDQKLWTAFARRFRAEMSAADPAKILDLLAALSESADFAMGCYCPEENWCHRSILRQLLGERGARIG